MGISDYLAPASCGGDIAIDNGWDPNGPGLPNDAGVLSIQSPVGILCSDSFTPKVTLRNFGSNDLTSCIINYNVDGGANQTYNWTGSLISNGSEIVTLPSMTSAAGAHVFNAYTSNPNSTSDTDPLNNASSSSFEVSSGGVETQVTLSTDCWGYETYWEITDGTAAVVASGGNTTGIAPGGNQTANAGDPGSYGDETTITEIYCLAVGCYDFTIYDDFGDGLAGSTEPGCSTDGDYQITNTSGTVLTSLTNVAFGNSETNNFCVVDNAGIEEINLLNLSVYPNPTEGQFTLSFENPNNEQFEVRIFDLSGRIISTLEVKNNMTVLDLHKASNGTYFLTLSNSSMSITKSIVVNK